MPSGTALVYLDRPSNTDECLVETLILVGDALWVAEDPRLLAANNAYQSLPYGEVEAFDDRGGMWQWVWKTWQRGAVVSEAQLAEAIASADAVVGCEHQYLERSSLADDDFEQLAARAFVPCWGPQDCPIVTVSYTAA